MASVQRSDHRTALPRSEWTFSIAFLGAVLALFLISFTGRSVFGDSVKTVLTGLSALAGGVGALGGVVILSRSVREQDARFIRIILGGLVTFVGAYTVIHVLG